MKRIAVLLLVLGSAFSARAADVAPSYAVPGFLGPRVGSLVILCPSSDGSVSAVVCAFGGGGSSIPVTNAGTSATTAGAVQGVAGGVPVPTIGPTAAGSPATTAPVQLGGVDGSGNVRAVLTDTSGHLALPSGAATAANQPALSILYTASTSVSVGTTSGTLFTAGAYPHAVTFCTTLASTSNVWLSLTGSTAVAGQGTPIYGGGGCTALGGLSLLPMPTSAVTAITDGGSAQALAVSGG